MVLLSHCRSFGQELRIGSKIVESMPREVEWNHSEDL